MSQGTRSIKGAFETTASTLFPSLPSRCLNILRHCYYSSAWPAAVRAGPRTRRISFGKPRSLVPSKLFLVIPSSGARVSETAQMTGTSFLQPLLLLDFLLVAPCRYPH